MTPDLPAELRVALERKADGLSRNDAARRARTISDSYRSGGNSKTISTDEDAIAYALARMPATYAAVANCLGALMEAKPDFTPETFLDVGAGPGTASWAAMQTFPSLRELTLLDSNESLRNLAMDLAADNASLQKSSYHRGNAGTRLAETPSADLIIASYFIGELADGEHSTIADVMWSKTKDTLLVVEPGTPAGYKRIVELRARLIAQGAHVVAPCPHDDTCPLTAPDWCHFTQRLARSRAHKQLKDAALGFEDEKFSYVVLSRKPVAHRKARVLAQPKTTKIAVTLKLCTSRGLQIANIPHRDKRNYSIVRKLNWGNVAPEKIFAPE
ncbi:MAG: SAM-dependent methyltransferase [Afipia sp.]|nr:SAM-dependent methyltransferase [Afipia sp.]